MNNKVALIVGHSEDKQGADNYNLDMTEFRYNDKLTDKIQGILAESGKVYPIKVYRGDYSKLPKKVNSLGCDIAIEFHCNAFDKSVSGGETLHYLGSKKGKKLATLLQNKAINVLSNNNRGVKEVDRLHRGGYLLHNVLIPCCITEPFFIDNDEELKNGLDNIDKLASAYAEAIEKYFE